MLDQGCRAIAFVIAVGPREDPAQRAWRQGYARALAAAGIRLDEASLVPWSVTDDPRPLWQRLIARRPRPTGVLVYNAELAARLGRVVQSAGVRLPAEMAIVSCGDAEFHEYLNVPLTAVAVDHRELAAGITARLLAQVDHPAAPPRHIWVKPHLVVRESSRRRGT